MFSKKYSIIIISVFISPKQLLFPFHSWLNLITFSRLHNVKKTTGKGKTTEWHNQHRYSFAHNNPNKVEVWMRLIYKNWWEYIFRWIKHTMREKLTVVLRSRLSVGKLSNWKNLTIDNIFPSLNTSSICIRKYIEKKKETVFSREWWNDPIFVRLEVLIHIYSLCFVFTSKNFLISTIITKIINFRDWLYKWSK